MLSRESTKIKNKINENAALPDNISKIKSSTSKGVCAFYCLLGRGKYSDSVGGSVSQAALNLRAYSVGALVHLKLQLQRTYFIIALSLSSSVFSCDRLPTTAAPTAHFFVQVVQVKVPSFVGIGGVLHALGIQLQQFFLSACTPAFPLQQHERWQFLVSESNSKLTYVPCVHMCHMSHKHHQHQTNQHNLCTGISRRFSRKSEEVRPLTTPNTLR